MRKISILAGVAVAALAFAGAAQAELKPNKPIFSFQKSTAK